MRRGCWGSRHPREGDAEAGSRAPERASHCTPHPRAASNGSPAAGTGRGTFADAKVSLPLGAYSSRSGSNLPSRRCRTGPAAGLPFDAEGGWSRAQARQPRCSCAGRHSGCGACGCTVARPTFIRSTWRTLRAVGIRPQCGRAVTCPRSRSAGRRRREDEECKIVPDSSARRRESKASALKSPAQRGLLQRFGSPPPRG